MTGPRTARSICRFPRLSQGIKHSSEDHVLVATGVLIQCSNIPGRYLGIASPTQAKA